VILGRLPLALMCAAFVGASPPAALPSAAAGAPDHRAPMESLRVQATIKVGGTADWVAITPGAIWVGSTAPDAVSRIDPRANRRVATVPLPGEPCAAEFIRA
jgi:streptogramin lyase